MPVMLRLIAVAMAQPMTTTGLTMVATASALGVSVATTVGLHRPAMPLSIVLDTEARLTRIQVMAAIAPARKNFMGTTVPFHQLATAAIAMGMPLWTWTVRMDACATVRMGGPAVIARLYHRAMQQMIATAMASQTTSTSSMAVCACASRATQVMIVLLHRPAM